MNVGFIGLGIMGRPMAKNLIKAGYSVYCYDIVKENVDNLADSGAIPCINIKEICENCKNIITMLPNSPDVREVVLGRGGIYDNGQHDTLVIDMSSISPIVSQEIYEKIADKDMHIIDAPVSGGEPKAIDGTLSIMVGGRKEDYERALPIFKIMGASYNLIGDIGSGNICKLANQIIVAVNIAAVSEGLMLAKCAGADPQKVFEGIRGGLAGSEVMNAKVPMMLEGEFEPGFRIGLHIKDLNNVLETGARYNVPLPLTKIVQNILKELLSDGFGSKDHSAIVKYYEKITGISLKTK